MTNSASSGVRQRPAGRAGASVRRAARAAQRSRHARGYRPVGAGAGAQQRHGERQRDERQHPRRRRARSSPAWCPTLSPADHAANPLPALLDRRPRRRARSAGSTPRRRPRRARTAARRSRTARRGCTCRTCRGRASSTRRSARRAGAAGTGPILPAFTSADAAPSAMVTAFDFGATASAMRRVGEVEPGLGHPDQLHRLRRGDRGGERGRVGQPDVLAGEDHQPSGDEAGVLPRFDHPGQVVHRGVGVGAAHRLDEGAGDVVVLVALPVVAHRGLVDRRLGGRQVDHVEALGDRRSGGGLEVGQRTAGVAAGEPDQVVERVVVDRDDAAEPAFVGQAPGRPPRGRRRRSATRGGAAGCARAAARSRRRTGSRWSPRSA